MSEHDEQVKVIQWARFMQHRWPCLAYLHAIPNGAKYGSNRRLAIIQAGKMHAEGLLPGVPDLFLPWPSKGKAGFYIEMKAPGKLYEVRPGQAAFMAYAEGAGYLCQVHDSADAAIESITWYLTEEAAFPLWDQSIKVPKTQGVPIQVFTQLKARA